MTNSLLTLVLAASSFGFAFKDFAVGQPELVANTASRGSFTVAQGGQTAMIYVDAADWPGVIRAANDLKMDVNRVTGLTPTLTQAATGLGADTIIVGTIGKSPVIDKLVKSGKVNVKTVKGEWESYVIQVVANPLPGVRSGLVIAGSDKRGTIYGIYNLSEQMGVSPWYFWADVPVPHQDAVFVKAGRYVQGPPSVKYRGIFINDESPDLTEWVREKFGNVPNGIGGTTANYGRQVYTNIFELLLRIKANYMWPAMWNNRFSMDDPENAPLADLYGIVIGTSHQDPLLRSEKEWTWGPGNNQATRDRNYATHPDALNAFWREGLEMNKNYESILTLGLRGAGDRPMIANATDEQSMALLTNIVADQRKLIADVYKENPANVPQLWCPYKEVQAYYEKGMRVPDDVTILWAEDNNGNLRRVPTPNERKRAGGAGIYYHMDYVGGPRNYKWINTSPIAKIYEQLSMAKQYGADRIWIVNVGHFKGYELPMQYFMDLGYNSDRWTADNINEYTRLWSAEQFGPALANDVADIMSKYSKYNGRRKPEQLQPSSYSLLNYQEAETDAADFKAIADKAEAISKQLPEAQKAAFYELVQFPAEASANLHEMYLAAAQNQLYAAQGRASAAEKDAEVHALFNKDAEMTKYYNKTLLDGRWDHFMDQTHIGYTMYSDPQVNTLGAISLAEPRATNAPAAPTNTVAATNSLTVDTNAAATTSARGGRGGGGRGGFGRGGGGGFGRGGGGFGGGARNTVLPDAPETSDMGVAVEGIQKAFTNSEDADAMLPQFDAFNQQKHFVEVFNKGKTPFAFTAKASVPWITLSQTSGTTDHDQRVWVSVDWASAPKGSASGTVTISGAGANVAVKVGAFNPTDVTRATLHGFVEGEGVVSIEPEHFTRKVDSGKNKWVRIEDYGRTLSGMRAMSPVDVSATPLKNSPSLEYQMYLFSTNNAEVTLITSPILNYVAGRGVQVAVSLDGGKPELLTIVKKDYAPSGNDWETSVKDNARYIKATLPVAQAGYHTLKIWMVDPGVVVQKLVVNVGGLKPSYLGPPESYHSAISQRASLN